MQRAVESTVTVCLCLVLCMLLDIVVSVSIPDNHRLHDALHQFDVLHKSHLRHRIRKEHQLLHFTTLNRTFQLVLHPRKTQFHKDLQVHIVEGSSGDRRKHGINFHHFHQGSISGDPDSSVIAHLDPSRGLLTASIRSGDEYYFIEPSHRHFTQSHDFHMISYRTSDLKYNLTSHPSEHYCGTKHDHTQMNTAQRQFQGLNKQSLRDLPFNSNDQDVAAMRKEEAHNILKRQSSNELRRDSCPLHIVANHKFHNEYSPSKNVDDTILFMILVIDMVDQNIYRNTVWENGRLGLTIRNVTVYTNASPLPVYNSERNWISNDLLEEFSHANWSDVCLAHLFTAESLLDGRLGVAYIASSNPGLTGGVCSSALVNFNGEPIVTANVGVSSLLRDGRKLLLAEAQLITAHEIGHNWGSEHDPTNNHPCNPGLNNGGSFLMFPSATDGNQANNDEFSSCSISMINNVLRSKSQCFIGSTSNQCGDYEVGTNETCDAGFLGMIGQDTCCTSECTLRVGMVCSDVNDPCCENCNYANNETVCRILGGNDCLADVKCNGVSKECPPNEFLPLGTECRGSGTCQLAGTTCFSNGTCDNSTSSNQNITCFNLCELYGMNQCFCTSETPDECHFCCATVDSSGSSGDCEVFRRKAGDSPLNLPDGTTCLGGLCNSDGICETVEPDLIQRLFSLFTDISIDNFVQFVEDNIVSTVLFVTAVIWIPFALSIHCCYDRKVWKEFKEEVAREEQERLLFEDETERDLFELVNLVAMVPAINLDQAKKGLQRMSSRKEGRDLFRSDSGNYYLPSPTSTLESPTKRLGGEPTLPSITEECDPARDNIWHHLSSSQGADRESSFETTTTSQTPFLATDV